MNVRKLMMTGLVAAVVMTAGETVACSAVIVGRKASASGRVIVAHNDDGALTLRMRYAMVPARDGKLAYYWAECKDPKGGVTPGDTMLNESGVFICSNNGGWMKNWCGRSKALPDEGEYSTLANGGFGYELRRTIAEYAHSAREGVDLAADMLSSCGYTQPSRNFIIADKDEAWVVQVVYGRRFAARRCPDDAVVAYPNCMTITTIEPGDIVSANIAAQGDDFDFIAAYQGPRDWKSPYNFYRMKHLYRIVCGRELDISAPCPFSMKPVGPVTQECIKEALASHYEGTEDEMIPHHPTKAQEISEEFRAPICRYGTRESYVITFAEKLEDTDIELAVGRPCETPYAHYRPYAGIMPPNAVHGEEALRRVADREVPLPPPARVGIFSGNGPRANGFMEYLRLVHSSPELTLLLLDADDIRGGGLASVDVLVMPGGDSRTEKSDLGPEGAARIREFLRAGGGYIGSCAGCCLLLDERQDPERGIGVIPYHRTGSKGGYMMPVTVNAAGAKALGIEAKSYTVRYHGGPVLEPSANMIGGAKFEIWATYDEDFGKPGQGPDMVGRGAMVGGTYGKGRVFAFAVHPENHASTRELVHGAFRYVLGRDVSFPERGRRVGACSVGWYSNAVAGKESALAMLTVDAMPEVDLIPMASDEILVGMLDHVDLLVLPDGLASFYSKKLTTPVLSLIAAFQSRGGVVIGWGEGAKAGRGLARDCRTAEAVQESIRTGEWRQR